MIRIDMSEYQDGGVSVDKLIGMPRGIVGSERGGILTNQLKDNPCYGRPARRRSRRRARACSTCSCRRSTKAG